MNTFKVIDYARQLLAAHGDRAEAEAAQKAASSEADGKHGLAESWRKVRRAIREMRSSKVS